MSPTIPLWATYWACSRDVVNRVHYRYPNRARDPAQTASQPGEPYGRSMGRLGDESDTSTCRGSFLGMRWDESWTPASRLRDSTRHPPRSGTPKALDPPGLGGRITALFSKRRAEGRDNREVVGDRLARGWGDPDACTRVSTGPATIWLDRLRCFSRSLPDLLRSTRRRQPSSHG